MILEVAAAQGVPEAGDWRVTRHERIEGQSIRIPGNIFIEKGGTLEVIGSTMIMAADPPMEPAVVVMDGGFFFLNGTSSRPSNLSDNDQDVDGMPGLDYFYHVWVQTGGILSGTDCILEGMGSDSFVRQNLPNVFPAWPLDYGFFVNGTARLERCDLQRHQGFGSQSATIEFAEVRERAGSTLQLIGSDVSISNSSFEDTMNVVASASLRVVQTSFGPNPGDFTAASNGRDKPTVFGEFENIRFRGLSTCHTGSGNQNMHFRSVQFESCGIALELRSGANYFVENAVVMDSTAVGEAGAIVLDGSHLVLQNASITGSSQTDVLVKGQVGGSNIVTFRNVSWQRRVSHDESTHLRITLEGMLAIHLPDAGAGKQVRVSREGTGEAFVASTDSAGTATVWVPVAEYDGSRGWTEFEKTVLVSSQGRRDVTLEATSKRVDATLERIGGPVPATTTLAAIGVLVFATLGRRGRDASE